MDGLPFIGLHVLEGKVKISLLFTHLFICIYMCAEISMEQYCITYAIVLSLRKYFLVSINRRSKEN